MYLFLIASCSVPASHARVVTGLLIRTEFGNNAQVDSGDIPMYLHHTCVPTSKAHSYNIYVLGTHLGRSVLY